MKDMKIKTNKKRLQVRAKKTSRFKNSFQFILRGFIFIATVFIIIFIMLIGQKPYIVGLHEGDISSRDIYAPFNFKYIVGVNEKLTKSKKQEAYKKAGEVYLLQDVSGDILNNLSEFLTQIVNLRNNPLEKIPADFFKKFSSILTKREIKILIESDINKDKLLRNLGKTLKDFYSKNYLISNSDWEGLLNNGVGKIYLKKDNQLSPLDIGNPNILVIKKAKKLIENQLSKNLPFRRNINQIFSKLVSYYLKPNLTIDKEATKQIKEKAANLIEPVYIKEEVKKNERIVTRGDKIKKDELLKLKKISEIEGKTKTPLVFGFSIISLLFLVLIVIFLKIFDYKFYKDNSKFSLIITVFILIILLSKLIVIFPIPGYLVPVAAGSILLTMLCNYSVAIKLTIVIAFLSGIIVGNDLNHILCFLLGGLVGIISVINIKRRSQLLKAGILIGGIQFLAIIGMDLIANIKPQLFLREALLGFSNGIISAFLAMGLLPFFEHTFRVVTNISLLELSDLNHPLLKELLVKAPGTYHHSLVVSQLAEQAAEAIGANALLARVGGYFHDIGKIEKPEYFSENADEKKKSRHEKLSPSMSSLIIINHVKVGGELARKYKLPQVIIDFIEQHHGTSLVYFFYHKALEKAPEQIKEEQFRYAGPKPQTKEVATVLLADAVEAASRSLVEPTSARIKRLVMQIIDAKFMEGELNECELTLKDLHTIASVFSRILIGIYHTRIEYPGERKEKAT
jgi:hypothetical protein